MQLEGYTRVCSISEIKESDSKSFNVDDTPVLICHTNKGYFAIENKCSHQTAELEGGKIRSCFIFCPKPRCKSCFGNSISLHLYFIFYRFVG